jgi:large subunit ribosomal protein L9
MKVILKHNVENLGRRGDLINVAAGYGRNFLIPKKLAMEVTASNLKGVEIEQQALKKKAEQERLSFQSVIQKLNDVTLTFPRKAGEKDVIFGSVSASDVKDALEKMGFEIDKKKIVLDEPIKRLGNFTVPIKIYHDDKAEVKIEVVKEE